MKQRQYIQKAISIPLYLIVIYYLLPFRPMYLYYSAQHNPAAVVNELNREKADQNNNTLSLNKQFSKNNDTFPKKDKVRFFFKNGFTVTATLTNQFVISSKDEIRTFLHPCYQPPLILFALDRGPPMA